MQDDFNGVVDSGAGSPDWEKTGYHMMKLAVIKKKGKNLQRVWLHPVNHRIRMNIKHVLPGVLW